MLFSGLSKGKNIFRFYVFYRHAFYFGDKVELMRWLLRPVAPAGAIGSEDGYEGVFTDVDAHILS